MHISQSNGTEERFLKEKGLEKDLKAGGSMAERNRASVPGGWSVVRDAEHWTYSGEGWHSEYLGV